MPFRLLALLVFSVMAVPQLAEASTSSLSKQLCDHIQSTFGHDSDELHRVQVRVLRRHGVRCDRLALQPVRNRRLAQPVVVSQVQTLNTTLALTRVDLTSYRAVEQRFVAALLQRAPLFTQAQLLSEAIEAYGKLSAEDQVVAIETLGAWGLRHLSDPTELPSRVRYNNNLALLTGLIKQRGSSQLHAQVRQLIDDVLLQRTSGETLVQFAKRRQQALALWDQRQVVLYYWPGTPNYDGVLPSAMQKHFALLQTITQLHAPIPGTEYLHLIVVRDDVGATASPGAVWLPSFSSLRTFIHELGHVLHDTKPVLKQHFGYYEQLFQASGEEDYVTSYHTNHREDFAELFTEYVLDGTVGQNPIDRALQKAAAGRPLLLQKLLFFLAHLFHEPSQPVWRYHFADDQLTREAVSVSRDSQARITGLRWGGQWYGSR